MDQKFRNIAEFYILANKLKQLIRTGWQQWCIDAPRLESVAEHVYGTQMLAIAVCLELDYDVDLKKVILMLAIHDLGEAIIGDITPLDQISVERKHKEELKAIAKIFSNLSKPETFIDLFKEFEEQQTGEAKFAWQIDKLEANMQVKLYDSAGYCDKDRQQTGHTEEVRRKYFLEGDEQSFSDAWLDFDLDHISYDKKFLEIVNWLKENELKEK
jgi:putative hydrolase of HD superfamily